VKFVHLTDLAGDTVSIQPEDIVELRPAEGLGHGPQAKTMVVLVNGLTQAVCETAAEIEAKLKDD
jgi:hypothetical protein